MMPVQCSCRLAVALVLGAFLFPHISHAIGQELGPLQVGGAMRVNYVLGDYQKDGSGAPQRGGNGGDFELDTFRVNLDYKQDSWIGAVEYRWYAGYNFLHTAYIGYEEDAFGRLEVGLNRTPFGVGAYGPANSWFFDQHYYVGLADTMKVGVKYTKVKGPLTVDLAYYPSDISQGQGGSDESSRYSYAVVPEDVADIPGSYRETHHVYGRAIYALEDLHTDFGMSAKWSQLDARDERASDSDGYAVSVHSRSSFGPVGLMLQLSSYEYDTDYQVAAGEEAPQDLIVFGGYDFAWPIASKGVIPSLAVSYTYVPEGDWADSVIFYNDYSVILKDGRYAGNDFNDSAFNITGIAIAKGGWYVYVDYGYSNGHLFIGNEDDSYDFGAEDSYANAAVGDFGANQNDKWNGRFNINFGYYF